MLCIFNFFFFFGGGMRGTKEKLNNFGIQIVNCCIRDKE